MSLPCLATALRYLVSYLGKRSIVTLLLQSTGRTIPAVYSYLWSGWRMTLPPPSRISAFAVRIHFILCLIFPVFNNPDTFVFLYLHSPSHLFSFSQRVKATQQMTRPKFSWLDPILLSWPLLARSTLCQRRLSCYPRRKTNMYDEMGNQFSFRLY